MSVGLIIWLMAIWKNQNFISLWVPLFNFSFILSCENRMQNGHLLIVRYYFYPTGRNESILRKWYVSLSLLTTKTFWKGFFYLLHKEVEPVLKLLWVLTKPQASRSILVRTTIRCEETWGPWDEGLTIQEELARFIFHWSNLSSLRKSVIYSYQKRA